MPLERGIVRQLILALLFLTAYLTDSPAALGAAAGITATPAAMQFSYQTGSAALPVAQTLQVQTSPAGLNFTAVVSGAPFNAAWLLVSAPAGVGPETLKVEVNPTGLAAGSYAGTIAFAAVSGAQTYTQAGAVTLLVSSPAPTLTATPTSLNFAYVTGAPTPSPALASAFILSSSGAALSATVSVTGATWLKVAPTGEVSLIGLFNTLSVTVNPAGLAPKVYSGTITVSAPGAVNKTTTVTVTLTVDAAVPAITGLWPGGVIQGAGTTVVTVEGSSYYPSSTITATGFAPAATITATDGTSAATETFVIPVYQPTAAGLRVNVASPLPGGVTGAVYSQPLGAAEGTSPYTYSLAAGMLPPGLAISGGNISGTPTAAGSYLFSVQTTDTSAPPITAYSLLKLTVNPAASAALGVPVAAAPLPLGRVGTVYGPVTLTAAGGTGGPYTWSAVNLPPGMSLSAAGVLSGTPSTDGAAGALVGSVVSDEAILATIPAATLAAAGVLRIAVDTPAPGGGVSNEGQFQIYGPGPQIAAVTNSAVSRKAL
jgi:large repetitive protein